MPVKIAFKRLQTLDPDVVEEVNRRLLAGETPSSVASWLQDDLKLLLDLKQGSVKKNLERYRSTDLQASVVKEIVDKVVGKSVAGVRRKLVALDEMERICIIQSDRVEKMLVKEKSLPAGILMKQTSDELRLFKEAVTELSKMQLETGIGMKRAPKNINGVILDEDGKATAFSWTQESDRLLSVIDQAAGVLDAKVIDHEH